VYKRQIYQIAESNRNFFARIGMLYAKIRRGSESAGGSAREARRAPAGLVYTDVIVDVSPVSMCAVWRHAGLKTAMESDFACATTSKALCRRTSDLSTRFEYYWCRVKVTKLKIQRPRF